MKEIKKQIRLAATDLSNQLACRHLTTLDLRVARGETGAPAWAAPDLKVIQELGLRHEKAYLKFLAEEKKLKVEDLSGIKDEAKLLEETKRLMEEGAEVIAQGALGGLIADGEWFGRADVLVRVAQPSGRWEWSYEVQDTKLAKETKATTILQLSLYSELLAQVQGCEAEFMSVIPPGKDFAGERYRVAEYAAYYRYVRNRLLKVVREGEERPTYPEPVPHCDVCRWFRECDARRRLDDHLSLVAGMRRLQQEQLVEWDVPTMADLAGMPIPLKERPERGSREGYERVREQARVQVQGREEKRLVHEAILPVTEGMGLCRLPEPDAGDVFLDLEGDPFAGENGLQYLFGFAFRDAGGELKYEKRWALNRKEEKTGFEWLVDEIMRRQEANPKMHVYHFGAYEPGALKRLMGMYATREDDIDRLLRAGTLVDLHQAFKQSTRASVEEYSLKKIEAFYGFARKTPLEKSRAAMRYVEHRLELGWNENESVPEEIRETMEGYNAEDCFSTAALRDWLEARREERVKGGETVPRPEQKDGLPPEELDERQKRVAALFAKLIDGLPDDPGERDETQQAKWLLAQLLDWHRREDKATWWEGFRLADLDEEELLEERSGVGGLRFLKRVKMERGVSTDRYSFEKQETEIREGEELYYEAEKFGTVVALDLGRREMGVKKTRKTAELHPSGVYLWDRPYNVEKQADALFRIGEWVAENGVEGAGRFQAARDLLFRRPPRLTGSETIAAIGGEGAKERACRIACALDDTIFAIQGPPGAGKTFTGARMICELVKKGKGVGVTALSHKVIRKLLDEVVIAAPDCGAANVLCMQRSDDEEETEKIKIAKTPAEALDALACRSANVVGGTSWLWSPEAAFECVDVLFIDEAGQMSLAEVLAVSQAAKNIVLIGDPQQLERPLKGGHPDGAEKSALEHLLGGVKTISPEVGLLLPETWRLHPKICEFTSEMFYEGRLASRPILAKRVLTGHSWVNGAGLWFVPVSHEGNQNSSPEEVEAIAKIVEGLLRPGVEWFRSEGNSRPLLGDDILIVAPYNAQVSDLSARLPGLRVGTVDKFQGQEAPVVIYSLTTSSPEDAPRGMEFLYSLNRFNVATSRAMSAVIVVGSPKLFEPECRSPRQMQLANALCRYLEMAKIVEREAI